MEIWKNILYIVSLVSIFFQLDLNYYGEPSKDKFLHLKKLKKKSLTWLHYGQLIYTSIRLLDNHHYYCIHFFATASENDKSLNSVYKFKTSIALTNLTNHPVNSHGTKMDNCNRKSYLNVDKSVTIGYKQGLLIGILISLLVSNAVLSFFVSCQLLLLDTTNGLLIIEDVQWPVQSLKLISFSIVAYFVYVYILKPVLHLIHMIIHYHGFPSYPKHFLLGHLKQFWTNFPFPYNLESIQRNYYEAINKMVSYNLGQSLIIIWTVIYPFIVAADHEAVEIVLDKKNLKKIKSYEFMGLGDGLITSTPDIWKVRRKLIEPFFSTKRLKGYVKTMNEEVESFSQKLNSEVDKPIDLEHLIHESTLNVILKSTLSVPLNDSMEDKKAIIELMNELELNAMKRTINPLYYIDVIFRMTKFGQSYYRTLDVVKKSINEFQRRRKLLLSSSSREPQDQDLVDILEGKIDEKGLYDELITMIGAGHETTAVALRWILFNLGNHLEAQERLYQEIIEFFPDDAPVDDMDKINECTYLDQCIKESLRISPSVHLTARTLEEDIMVKDKRLLAGSLVTVQIPSIHRNSDVYPEPDKFDPDRWSPENAAEIPKAAFIPFGYGPRSCIGYRYAILELKIYTIKIIRKFSLISVGKHESIPVKYEITLKPLVPLEVIMSPRN